MTSIRESIRQRFTRISPIEPGVYQYQAPQEDPRNFRVHLRVESSGEGVMIVNASTVLHLNQTATEHAYYLVQSTPEEEAADLIASRYRVSYEQALQDYADFKESIDTLVTIPDLDPIAYLGFDRTRPYSGEITAPYRLDCALTYQLPPGDDPQLAPRTRADRDLSTEEWKIILDKSWAAGIPHVIFTGGEPTLRDDLLELILYAEQIGQVTGLLTDGVRLDQPGYFDSAPSNRPGPHADLVGAGAGKYLGKHQAICCIRRIHDSSSLNNAGKSCGNLGIHRAISRT